MIAFDEVAGDEGSRHAAVAVLKGADSHEPVMEPGGHQQGVVGVRLARVFAVPRQEVVQLGVDMLGRAVLVDDAVGPGGVVRHGLEGAGVEGGVEPVTELVHGPVGGSVGAVRQSNGRKEQTSFCIVDSQSVKNTDSADSKGYDAGKKVSGIKRHIAVDTQGLPHAIHVTTANVTDRAGALAMFDENRADLSQIQKVLVDGGYTGKPFAAAVQSRLGAAVEVVKRNELHTFVVLPKRWVVERSFAWLEKCRRLWKNCERKLNTSLQMVVLAFMVLILKRS